MWSEIKIVTNGQRRSIGGGGREIDGRGGWRWLVLGRQAVRIRRATSTRSLGGQWRRFGAARVNRLALLALCYAISVVTMPWRGLWEECCAEAKVLSPHSRCSYPRDFQWRGGRNGREGARRFRRSMVGGGEYLSTELYSNCTVLRGPYEVHTGCNYCTVRQDGWLMTRAPDSRRAGRPAIRLVWLRSFRHLILGMSDFGKADIAPLSIRNM